MTPRWIAAVWVWNVAEDDSLGIRCRCATSSCRRGRTAVRSVTAAGRFSGSLEGFGCQQISGVAGQRGTSLARGTCVGEWGVMPPCVAGGVVSRRIATPAAEVQGTPAWFWRGCVTARHLSGCGIRVPDVGHSLGTCLQLLFPTPEPSRPSLPTPCSPARDQVG